MGRAGECGGCGGWGGVVCGLAFGEGEEFER